MLENLKLAANYDGFLFLADSARNPPALRAHHHVELELNLVVQGAISYVVGGRRFTFQRQTLLWLFPAQEHQLVDRTSDAQNYVAVFTPSLIARSCRSDLYDGLKRDRIEGEGVLHTTLPPDRFELLRKNMDALMDGAPDPDVLNQEAGFGLSADFRFEHTDPDGLNAGLHHLLLLAWRSQQAGTSLNSSVALHPSVRKALALLSAGHDMLDLTQLARRCGASEAHLSRMFARQVGLPLSRYRNTVRLERFFEHYRGAGQTTIAEAVYAAGFGSYAQFHRVFTEAYGRGPRAVLGEAASGAASAQNGY